MSKDAFYEAIRTQNLDRLVELLDSPNSDARSLLRTTVPDWFGTFRLFNHATPLHLAAEWNNLGMIRILVRYGANIHVQDEYQEIPLARAIRFGHVEAAELLIDLLRDDFTTFSIGGLSMGLMEAAIFTGHLKMIQFLFRRFEFPTDTAIIIALVGKQYHLVPFLLQHGARCPELEEIEISKDLSEWEEVLVASSDEGLRYLSADRISKIRHSIYFPSLMDKLLEWV